MHGATPYGVRAMFFRKHSIAILFVSLFVFLFLFAMPIGSKAERASAIDRAFALAVARTAANEASLRAVRDDVELVYEASRAHGRDSVSRLRWLRRHSRCSTQGDCNRDGVIDELDDVAATRRPGNSRWARYLTWGVAPPMGFPDGARWRPERWRRIQAEALRLVVRDEATGVCEGVRILSWGSRSDFLRYHSNLIPIPCGVAARDEIGRAHV